MNDKKEITPRNQCYSCKFKGSVPGSAHSSCGFDWLKQSDHFPPKADYHGIRNGWYAFPFNYDPVWQEELCKAFKQK